MNNTIIVTGANGYTGPYLIKRILDKGYNVIAIKGKHFSSVLLESDLIRYIDLDLAMPDAVTTLNSQISAQEIKAVVHLAAVLGCPDYDQNYKSNFLTTQTMLNYCKENKISRFIYLSTIGVKRINKGPYGKTKLLAENEVMKSDLDYTVLLPEMIIGRESLGFNRILKNVNRFPLFIPLIGRGKYIRHSIYVHDLSQIVADNIDNTCAFRKKYEIACGDEVSFANLVKMILSASNQKKILFPIPITLCLFLGKLFERMFKIPPFTSEHVLSLTENTYLDNSPAIEDLNYKPTALTQILEKTIRAIDNKYNYNLSEKPERKLPLEYFSDY